MNKFLTLFKFKFKYNLGITQLKSYLQTGPKAIALFILAILFVLLMLAAFLFLYVVMALSLYLTGKSLGDPSLMIKLMLTAGQLLMLVTGLFSAFNMMFGGKDYDFMASLPIKKGQIFFVNFAISYLIEIAFSGFIILPVMVIYALNEPVGITFWLFGILGIAAFPALPVCLSTLLMILFMSIMGRFKHREILVTIFSFVLCTAVIVASMMINPNTAESTIDENMFESLLSGGSGVINLAAYILPSAAFLSGALSSVGLSAVLNFLALLAITAVLIGITYWAGHGLYFKVLQKISVSGKKTDTKVTHRDFVSRSPVKAFFVKEWKLLLRSPVYALNSLINIVLGPIMLLVMFSTQRGGSDSENAMVMILDLAERYPSAAVCAVIFITIMVSGLNFAWATTISREGSSLWITKIIPVPVSLQMRGRLWAGYTMYLLCAVPMLILFEYFLRLQVLDLIFSCIAVLLAGIALVALDMMIDIVRPKIFWSTEAEAIKQNVNGVFAMLIALLLGIVLVLPGIFGTIGLLSAWAERLILLVLCIAASVLSYTGMLSLAEKRYKYI